MGSLLISIIRRPFVIGISINIRLIRIWFFILIPRWFELLIFTRFLVPGILLVFFFYLILIGTLIFRLGPILSWLRVLRIFFKVFK